MAEATHNDKDQHDPGYHRHCLAGNIWPGTPEGTITTLAGRPTYRVGDESSEIAILLIHDAGGWTFKNLRLLADYYARELGASVWMPDFFHGEVLDLTHLLDAAFDKVDLAGFSQRNSKEKRRSEIFACAAALRHGGPNNNIVRKVGAVGYCFGGWAVFQLAAQVLLPDGTIKPASAGGASEGRETGGDGGGRPLVDAISTGHPTFLTKEEIDETRVPTQIMAPEHDAVFTPELKKYANETIPTLGVEYDYRYFPGQVHGFVSRGSLEVDGERRASERARRVVVAWFREILLV